MNQPLAGVTEASRQSNSQLAGQRKVGSTFLLPPYPTSAPQTTALTLSCLSVSADMVTEHDRLVPPLIKC